MQSTKKVAIIAVFLMASIIVAAGVIGFFATTTLVTTASTSSSFFSSSLSSSGSGSSKNSLMCISSNNSSTTTATTTLNSTQEAQVQVVSTGFVDHLLNLESLNKTAIMADYDYQGNATIFWWWTIIGLDGIFTSESTHGIANISTLYDGFLHYTDRLCITNLSYTLTFNQNLSYSAVFNRNVSYTVTLNGSHYYDGRWEPGVAFVNSTFHEGWHLVNGHSQNASISAKLVYVFNNEMSRWLIESETWVFYGYAIGP